MYNQNMKHIIFVKNLNTQDDVVKIKDAFAESRVEYEILLDDKCVVVFGRNDIVRTAKTLLVEYGYIVD